MSKEQILERERRWALPTALAALGSVVLFVASNLVLAGGDVSSADGNAEILAAFGEESGRQLAVAILQAFVLVLFVPPLLYLFQAAAARSERMRGALVGLVVAGPLFLAIATIARYLVFDGAATDLVAQSPDAGQSMVDFADSLLEDQSAWGAWQGFNFAGILGLVFGVTYTSFYAMRTGLFTRFWGTLGMALAVSTLFLLGTLGVLIFVIAIGVMASGRWPRGRPPAWEAGEGMPWPKPGEEPPEPTSAPAEEPGLPEGFGGDGNGAGELDPDHPSAPDGPRKRKRRG